MKELKPTELTHFADHHRGYRHVMVENDVLAEEIMAPGYWVHYASLLKLGDKVDIMRKDMTLQLNLRVFRVEAGLVFMRPEYIYNDLEVAAQILADRQQAAEDEDDKRLPVPEGYKVGYVPLHGHYVQIVATGKMIYTKLENRAAAVKKAMAHQAAAAGTPAPAKAGKKAA